MWWTPRVGRGDGAAIRSVLPLTRVAALSGLALLSAAAPAEAQAPVPVEDLVLEAAVADGGTRVMAAAVTSYEAGRLSGLFITEPRSGWILYRRSEREEPERIPFDEFERIYRFRQPVSIVFADPRLYVYDAANRTIWSLLLQGASTKKEAELVSRLPEHPSHIAVSPHGLVAVIEGDQVVFLQRETDPIRYERSRFSKPIDLAFSAWNTLQVLDGTRNALVSITFSRLKSGEIEFETETDLPVPQGNRGQTWQAMAIYDGLVYLADETTVYAHLASDRRLVPVATRSGVLGGIQQLALTYESLYLLEPDHVHRFARTEPVDLALEGGPLESQRALLGLYTYLGRRDLLPTRRVRARRAYARLEDLLFENEVIVAPGGESASRFERSVMAWQTDERAATEESEFMALFCTHNEEFCAAAAGAGVGRPTLTMPVPQRTELEVPWVQLIRRLGKDRVDLGGQSLLAHAEWRVPSAEFRAKTDPSFLLRLNPGWSKEDLERRTRGTAISPVEQWTAIVAVPFSELEDKRSDLWSLVRRHQGVGLYRREVFTEQAARSLRLPPPPPGTTACETLKEERRKWLEAINYPARYQPLDQEAVRVGVLEYATTVKKRHQAFCLDSGAPSWHQAANLDFVAEPEPASYQNVARDVTDASTFSSEAHHGTHVAAIIGGRRSECWSGLLPRARLLLVDLTDAAEVRRKVDDGVDVDTRVFNVSQGFPDDQQGLHDTIRLFRDRAIFVVAAGNSGRGLNDADSAAVPAPARWGNLSNVVAVTGSDWGGDILSQLNHGKRYVDLAAPARDLYSASEPPGGYGPATGTSQAAPQVTAAAAMLVDAEGEARLSPGDAKARLIATADWKDAYKDKLWGGHLNFGRAVRFPQRSVVVTTTGAALGQLHAIEPDNDPWIEMRNAPTYYERHGEADIALSRVRFTNIISLEKLHEEQNDGQFRVVLREPGTDYLKIVLGAELRSGEPIRCETFERFDEESASFESSNGCDSGLGIDQIEEFVRGGAYRIRWKE